MQQLRRLMVFEVWNVRAQHTDTRAISNFSLSSSKRSNARITLSFFTYTMEIIFIIIIIIIIVRVQ